MHHPYSAVDMSVDPNLGFIDVGSLVVINEYIFVQVNLIFLTFNLLFYILCCICPYLCWVCAKYPFIFSRFVVKCGVHIVHSLHIPCPSILFLSHT